MRASFRPMAEYAGGVGGCSVAVTSHGASAASSGFCCIGISPTQGRSADAAAKRNSRPQAPTDTQIKRVVLRQDSIVVLTSFLGRCPFLALS